MNHTHILLASLGGQPQIVTFTLDLLLRKGFPIREVIVLHPRPSDANLQHALACLKAEFTGCYHTTEQVIAFHSRVLQLDGRPIDDIVDEPYADGTLDTIHRLISDLKRKGHHIHLSVTGGRRMIGLLATSVAALNFDRQDFIWHLYTPEEVQLQAYRGKIMHTEAEIKLIKAPFLALGAYISPYMLSFRTAQEEQQAQMEQQEHSYCSQVVEQTTPAQLRVLKAFSQGIEPRQVADQLHLSLSTVHSHKTELLRLCRNAWNIDEQKRLDYHFLQRKFTSYFAAY